MLMTERGALLYVICKRRWWTGGGFDVVEGIAGARSLMEGWPIRLGWFRLQAHAELFAAMLQGWTSGHGERSPAQKTEQK